MPERFGPAVRHAQQCGAHPRLGTHALTGALYAYWQSLGAFTSGLGHLAEVSISADPSGEQRARFEHGALTWSPGTGPRRS